MNEVRHLFDIRTGLITGRSMRASEEVLALNCPAGFGWVAGVKDWRSQRVDLDVYAIIQQLQAGIAEEADASRLEAAKAEMSTHEQRLLIDYVPPSPGDEHEWNRDRKRWVLRADVSERRSRRSQAIADIQKLEQSSLRALREVKLAELKGQNPEAQSVERLERIEQQIASLREQLK